ncbi:hypothetical protein ACLOJK_035957 [Asimina triloba]
MLLNDGRWILLDFISRVGCNLSCHEFDGMLDRGENGVRLGRRGTPASQTPVSLPLTIFSPEMSSSSHGLLSFEISDGHPSSGALNRLSLLPSLGRHSTYRLLSPSLSLSLSLPLPLPLSLSLPLSRYLPPSPSLSFPFPLSVPPRLSLYRFKIPVSLPIHVDPGFSLCLPSSPSLFLSISLLILDFPISIPVSLPLS